MDQQQLPTVLLEHLKNLDTKDNLKTVPDHEKRDNSSVKIQDLFYNNCVPLFSSPYLHELRDGGEVDEVINSDYQEFVTSQQEHYFNLLNSFKDYQIDYDEIEKAKIAVCIPNGEWNGGVLIHCHGHRAKGIPLQADLNHDNMPNTFRELISQGWIVSMTSYRREGIILKDAILDVNNLRNYIEKKHGEIKCCILEGRSMGGAIVTYISEMHSHLYDGAVCIGAALRVDQKEEPLPHLVLQNTPKFPIIYLTNISELGEPSSYIEKAKNNLTKEQDIVTPSLWTVFREGHNLVTELERMSAFQSLISWIRFKSNITLKVNEDCTLPVAVPTSEVEFTDSDPSTKEGAWGKIKQLYIYGSFCINFTEKDFEQLGITQGKYFTFHIMTKQQGIKTVSAAFGSFPFIKQATEVEWVAFVNPVDNYIVIHVNTYKFTNEAKKMGISHNDAIFVEKVKLLPKRRKTKN